MKTPPIRPPDVQYRSRARWLRRWLEETAVDLRYAARMMGRTPGISVTAVLTLALGLGVNAALFSVFDFIVLRPLPSRDPDELVDIRAHNEQVAGHFDARFSYADYLDYRAQTQAFSALVAVKAMRMNLQPVAAAVTGYAGEAAEEVVSVQAVSGNYFSVLGANVVLGRDFLPEEAGARSGRPVIVLSALFWETRLRGDPGVLGATLTLSSAQGIQIPYTIIGVTEPDFLGQSVETPVGWIPLTADASTLGDRMTPAVALTGRMKAGVSTLQAKADLDAIARRLAQSYPGDRRPRSVQLSPAMRLVDLAEAPGVLMALSPVILGFALTLVIACLNVANLLLARGITRQHEIGVRLTLGASRARIVRQVFAENFLLCVIGAGAALLLALWTLQALRPVMLSAFADLPEVKNYLATIHIGVDRHIVEFGAVLAIVAGIMAGLVPALQSVRSDAVFALKGDGSVFSRGITPLRLRSLLLVAQVAVCLTTLAVAGLITGKLFKIGMADAGFSVDHVYQMRPSEVSGAATALARDPLGAVETLRTLPGVTSACLVSETPLRKPGDNFRLGLVKTGGGDPQKVLESFVSAGFFETFGVAVSRGRAFTAQEVTRHAPVAIVSDAVARRLWPGQDPVGQFLAVDVASTDRSVVQPAGARGPVFRDCAVIGVAPGIRNNWSQNDRKEVVWLPMPATGMAGGIFVRLQTDTTGPMREVERSAAAAGFPVEFQQKLATIVSHSLWPFRMFAWVSAVLSGLALVMATVGLYGMMSFGVNQRVHEIGVRMALGATTARVTRLFVRQGMRWVTYGVVVGLIGGAAFAVLVMKTVPGAGFGGDWAFRCTVFAGVTAFLSGVALVACWLPARRAGRLDPMQALRE
jgi:putative ABC transport system permease protein